MKLRGTFVWTVGVEVDVPEDASDDHKRMLLDEAVEQHLPHEVTLRNMVLVECSDDNLVD